MIGTLRNAGFSVALTAHAFLLIDSYIYGFAMQENSLPLQTEEEAAALAVAVASAMMARLPASEYPYLAELTVEPVIQPGSTYGDEFKVRLDLVLGALEAALLAPAGVLPL